METYLVKLRFPVLALLLASSALHAVEPSIPRAAVAPMPPPATIKFPELMPDVPGPKPVDPAAVAKLTADVLYVVQSDAPFLLFASPPDLVTVTKESGPLRVRGKFIDGAGKVETRTLNGKHIAIVEAAVTGKVELIAVPVGADTESGAIRKTVDVDAGQGPIPPPKPKPDDPKPPPKPPEPVKSFRVIWVHESSATIPQAQIATMDAKAVRDYLTANCTKDGNWPGWRRWDKDTDPKDDFPTLKEIWGIVKPKLADVSLPCVVIAVNDRIAIEPFPKSAQDAIALFTKYKEGK
jgi:hypothetical protein